MFNFSLLVIAIGESGNDYKWKYRIVSIGATRTLKLNGTLLTIGKNDGDWVFEFLYSNTWFPKLKKRFL